MKTFPILAPASAALVLLSAVVLAGPQSSGPDGKSSGGPNRAEAYLLASN